MNKINHRVLVSLDAVLDTRLAILLEQAPDAIGPILESGRWHTRDRADPTLVDATLNHIDWPKVWANRDADLLPSAFMTYIPRTIADLAIRYRAEGPKMGMEGTVELTINHYPYRLSDAEREALRDVFMTQYFCDSVNFASLDLHAYRQTMLYSFDTVILDDLDAWYHANHATLNPETMPATQVYAPLMLAKDSPPMTPAMMASALRIAFESYFQLELLPVQLFSLIRREDLIKTPDEKEAAEDPPAP